MPAKGKSMSPEQKEKLRAGMYRRFYGENWQEVVEQKKAAKENSYRMPIQSPEFMGKRELLRLIIARLRDPGTPVTQFADLARTYAGMKQWFMRQRRLKRHPQIEIPDRERLDKDINTIIQQIEASRKPSHG